MNDLSHASLDFDHAEQQAIFEMMRPWIIGGSIGFVAGCFVTVAIAFVWSLFL